MFPCDLPDRAARPELPATFLGGCHCGAVRYRVDHEPFDRRNWEAHVDEIR